MLIPIAPEGAESRSTTRPLVPPWMPFLAVLGLIEMATPQGFRPIGDPDTWWHLRRGEAFPKAQFEDGIKTSQVLAGWRRFHESTGSTYAVVRERSPLATALGERLDWRCLGKDDGHVLLAAPSERL